MDEAEQTARPKRSRRALIARIAVVLVLANWVISGYGKVTDLNQFVHVVSEHRVLDQAYYGVLWAVGPIELLIGLLLVFVAGSELTKPFGRAVLVLSMLGVIALSVYLLQVDPAVIRESGCGCLDALGRVDFGIKGSERTIKLAFNGVLVALHLVALILPIGTRRTPHDTPGGSGTVQDTEESAAS